MPEQASSLLFLAVPGTQDTRQLDLESVREAVARGEITLDNWAWSAERNEWVPLAQLPEFAAPEFAEPVLVEPVPVIVAPHSVKVQVPIAEVKTRPLAATYHSKSVVDERPHETPVLGILFVGLTLLIAALVGVNYFLIEKPFRAKMAQTPFADISTHAHLGAFMQPTALLIHILPSHKITSDNFADLLTVLTQAAPRQAIPGMTFKTVSLTPGWMGRYLIGADDWDGFAEMGSFTPREKRQFVVSHMERGNGRPLLVVHQNESDDQRKQDEDKVWDQVVATFQAP